MARELPERAEKALPITTQQIRCSRCFQRKRSMPLDAAVTAEIAKGYSIPKITAAPLATPPYLWVALLYVLARQLENAGVLGKIVVQADQASVVPKLGGDPSKARTAPKQSLQRMGSAPG